MSDNFQQTVDLREQMAKTRKSASMKKAVVPLEEIYEAKEGGAAEDFEKISRPRSAAIPTDGLIRLIVFILAILVVGATVYGLFFRPKGAGQRLKDENWYAVKLVNGEVIYGQILDIKADPVAMTNVYYNYDQAQSTGPAKDQTKTIGENGNLRLVKRGKETQGGNGSMNVVRGQVLYMEPLKSDSKVLQAILGYEK
jgi:hypothetical protein